MTEKARRERANVTRLAAFLAGAFIVALALHHHTHLAVTAATTEGH